MEASRCEYKPCSAVDVCDKPYSTYIGAGLAPNAVMVEVFNCADGLMVDAIKKRLLRWTHLLCFPSVLQF